VLGGLLAAHSVLVLLPLWAHSVITWHDTTLCCCPLRQEGQVTDRILPIAEVVKIVGLSRRSVYRELKSGQFPRPVQLSARRVGWKESAVQAWLDARTAA